MTRDKQNKKLIIAYKKANKDKKTKYINELYTLNEGLIVFLVRKYVYDMDDFEDLKNQAFLVLLNCAKRFDVKKKTHFSTYLATAIKNEAIKTSIRNKLIQTTEENIDKNGLKIIRLDKPVGEDKNHFFEIPVEHDFDKNIEEFYLFKIMKKVLSEQNMDIIKMYFWEDLTMDQIAERIHKNRETVRIRLYRAIFDLRKYIVDHKMPENNERMIIKKIADELELKRIKENQIPLKELAKQLFGKKGDKK